MWSIPATHPKTVSQSVVLQSSRSLTKAKPSSEYLAVGNFYQRDFPATSIPVEEHTNRRASLRSTIRWKPRRKITLHVLTCADLRSGIDIHAPARGGECDTVFTHLLQQMRMPPTSPFIHSTHPAVAGKALFFHFFSLATVTAFFCRLNLHCSSCFLELYDIFRTLGVVSVDSY